MLKTTQPQLGGFFMLISTLFLHLFQSFLLKNFVYSKIIYLFCIDFQQ